MKRLFTFCLVLVLCVSASALAAESGLRVKHVGIVPDDFIFGMDLSSVISLGLVTIISNSLISGPLISA